MVWSLNDIRYIGNILRLLRCRQDGCLLSSTHLNGGPFWTKTWRGVRWLYYKVTVNIGTLWMTSCLSIESIGWPWEAVQHRSWKWAEGEGETQAGLLMWRAPHNAPEIDLSLELINGLQIQNTSSASSTYRSPLCQKRSFSIVFKKNTPFCALLFFQTIRKRNDIYAVTLTKHYPKNNRPTTNIRLKEHI